MRTIVMSMVLFLSIQLVSAQNVPVRHVVDADLTGSVRWSKDTTYIMHGKVFVENGAELTIDSGTVIKGFPAHDSGAAALIICRGGKIHAVGTKTAPIIFTSYKDDVNKPLEMGSAARGQWGGIIVLGKAPVSRADESKNRIEGINSSDDRGYFGGTDPNDNSGELKYVSIRHGGAIIGENNEINGLTFAGVGSGTVVDHIEVFDNADDGFEWFGGTVNCKYLISAYNADDCFDFDLGYRGKLQFLFSVQHPSLVGNRLMENDGVDNQAEVLFTSPTIANATFLGAGKTSKDSLGTWDYTEGNDFGLIFRERAAGKFYNSIFCDFAGKATKITNTWSDDSYNRLVAGDLKIKGCIFNNFKSGNTWSQITSNSYEADTFSNPSNKNAIVDPKLYYIERSSVNGKLDPRPALSGPAYQNLETLADAWFTTTQYKGAFDFQEIWFDGWTALTDHKIGQRMFIITPFGYEHTSRAKFDVSFLVKIPNVQLGSYTIKLNGNNVSAAFASMATSALMSYAADPAVYPADPATNVGTAFTVPGVSMGVGKNTLEATMTFTSGGKTFKVSDKVVYYMFK